LRCPETLVLVCSLGQKGEGKQREGKREEGYGSPVKRLSRGYGALPRSLQGSRAGIPRGPRADTIAQAAGNPSEDFLPGEPSSFGISGRSYESACHHGYRTSPRRNGYRCVYTIFTLSIPALPHPAWPLDTIRVNARLIASVFNCNVWPTFGDESTSRSRMRIVCSH